jgi:peptide deformylase
MDMLEIYVYGSPLLRRKTRKVEQLPNHFPEFLERMFVTMHNDDGIGLSANQVGVEMQFFIADFSLHDKNFGREVFINPEIIAKEGSDIFEEGCLSVPEIREKVTRAFKIKVRYENLIREIIEKEFDGFFARVIQHETDHLNGILFIDHISSLKRSFLNSKLKTIAQKGRTQTNPLVI